jgi:hypothetical protein
VASPGSFLPSGWSGRLKDERVFPKDVYASMLAAMSPAIARGGPEHALSHSVTLYRIVARANAYTADDG